MFFLSQRGLNNLTVGGVRFLDDFSDTCVCLRVDGASLTIEGEKLEISHFNVNEVLIKGSIEKISMAKRANFLKRSRGGDDR